MPPTPHWSRRTLLAASAATAVSASLAGTAHAAGAAAAPADDFAALRKRWLELRNGTGFDPAAEPYASRLKQTGIRATAHRKEMRPTDDSLFPDFPFDPPSGITQSYERLATMAEAYVQPGTGLTGDAGLADDILTGLEHVHARVYNKSTEPYGNWWEWQIGSPLPLLDIALMLREEISAASRDKYVAAVDHFVPESVFDDYSGLSTGANRVDYCRVYAVRGILGEAPGKIALASDSLAPVFPHVTEGDGLYRDGSFIQHTWVAYSGTYGYVLLDGLGRLFTLLDGTSWEVTDPNRQIVLDSVGQAYAPLLHDGLMMDGVSGRAISRGVLKQDAERIRQSDHTRGHLLIAAIALMAGAASEEERTRFHAMVRGWTERDTVLPVLTDPQFGVADLARLHAVADEAGEAAQEPVSHRMFPAMARAVHRRPGWCAGISMASDRVSYYEAGNGENPRGWHTGAGMLYWWGPDGTLDQYADDFWPTVDWYRLPGTTVSTKRLADNAGGEWGEPKPAARWAGGATDGEFAAVGQRLEGLGSTLTAVKSWFCAADTVICLGAGISAAEGERVETVFDNRNLGAEGAHPLTVDGERQPSDLGSTRTHGSATWAHLAGHGGWVWPGGVALSVRREARTGAWSDINADSVDDSITRRYVTLWTDHGTEPSAAGYAYLLMPGAGPRHLAARAADAHWLTVDANSGDCQAVTAPSLGLGAANFWDAGTAGAVTVTAPASVLIRHIHGVRAPGPPGRRAVLCVADPARTGREIELTWDRTVAGVIAADEGVETVSTGDRLRLRVRPGTAGASLMCTVLLG